MGRDVWYNNERRHKMAREIKTDFDEGTVILTVEKDGRVHCVECGRLLQVTLKELDGTGSAPVCRKCAGVE